MVNSKSTCTKIKSVGAFVIVGYFSRNPKIAEFLHQYDYVKEFGEGVDRMFNEMENAGLPDPEYTDNAFMLNVTIRNGKENGEVNGNDGEVNFDEFTKNEQLVYEAILSNADITRADLIETLDISARTIDRAIKSLKEKRAIERVGSDKTGHWRIIK